MPTYEYRCDHCHHEMEQFQSIKDKPLKKCPECGKPKLKRLISTGGGVIFKGAGFWQTDYRSESYKEGAKKDTAAESPSSSTETKGETKSEAKSEAKADATKPAAKPEKPAKTESKKKSKD